MIGAPTPEAIQQTSRAGGEPLGSCRFCFASIGHAFGPKAGLAMIAALEAADAEPAVSREGKAVV